MPCHTMAWDGMWGDEMWCYLMWCDLMWCAQAFLQDFESIQKLSKAHCKFNCLENPIQSYFSCNFVFTLKDYNRTVTHCVQWEKLKPACEFLNHIVTILSNHNFCFFALPLLFAFCVWSHCSDPIMWFELLVKIVTAEVGFSRIVFFSAVFLIMTGS